MLLISDEDRKSENRNVGTYLENIVILSYVRFRNYLDILKT